MEKTKDEIQQIIEKYVKKEAKYLDRFNIFNVLRVEHKELSHSNMIARLLNYGQGKPLLKEFLSVIELENLDFETATVDTEANIKKITKYEGRIDILVTIKRKGAEDFGLIIENKIYASDQDQQLYRYNDYGKNKFTDGNYKLLYLNLYGNSPSQKSLNGLTGSDYKHITYTNHIDEWLGKCESLIVTKNLYSDSLLKDNISQYKETLERFKSDEELKDITHNVEAFQMAIGEIKNIDKDQRIKNELNHKIKNYVIFEILKKTLEETLKEKCKNLGEFTFVLGSDYHKKNGAFWFKPEGWESAKNHGGKEIRFRFKKENYKDLVAEVRENNKGEVRESDSCNICNVLDIEQLYDENGSVYDKIFDAIEKLRK